MPHRLLVAVFFAGWLALAACSQADPEPLIAPPPEADVALDEYRIDAPERLPDGRVVFHTENVGEVAHSLSVVPLPQDFPATFTEHFAEEEQQIAFPTIFVLAGHPPGEKHRFALDLEAGRYGLLCTLKDDDGTPHSRMGMAAQFTVDD